MVVSAQLRIPPKNPSKWFPIPLWISGEVGKYPTWWNYIIQKTSKFPHVNKSPKVRTSSRKPTKITHGLTSWYTRKPENVSTSNMFADNFFDIKIGASTCTNFWSINLPLWQDMKKTSWVAQQVIGFLEEVECVQYQLETPIGKNVTSQDLFSG